jgi:hypothetical protein
MNTEKQEKIKFLKTLVEIQDKIFRLKQTILDNNNFSWQEIAPIDKISAIKICRENRDAESLMEATEKVNEFLFYSCKTNHLSLDKT